MARLRLPNNFSKKKKKGFWGTLEAAARRSYSDKQPGRSCRDTWVNSGESQHGAVTTGAPKGSLHVTEGVTKASGSPPEPAEPMESRTGNGGRLESKRMRLFPPETGQQKLKIPPRGSRMLHAGSGAATCTGWGLQTPMQRP